MRTDRRRLYEVKGSAIDFYAEMFKGTTGSDCSNKEASLEIIVVPPSA